jgi:hypothetical protein
MNNPIKSSYPPDWQLNDRDTKYFLEEIEKGLSTTNGDTAPITVTARQLILLMEGKRCRCVKRHNRRVIRKKSLNAPDMAS